MHLRELNLFFFLILSFIPFHSAISETQAPDITPLNTTTSSDSNKENYLFTENSTAYVSDKLFVYLRTGASSRHKLSGSITAGSSVTLLENIKSNDGFAHIQDPKGRKAWIETKWLTQTPSPSAQIPILKETIKQLKFELESLDQQKSDWKNSLTAISVENAKLSKKIKSLEEEREQHKILLAEQNQTLYMGWFVRGGLLAIGCMLIGVLLNYLPRRQKQSAGWV